MFRYRSLVFLSWVTPQEVKGLVLLMCPGWEEQLPTSSSSTSLEVSSVSNEWKDEQETPLSLSNETWLSKHPTLLATPRKWKSKGFFEQPSQRPGNHRTGMCHTCRGVRSLRKMIYHEVWDLSQLQTAELDLDNCFSLFTYFNNLGS